MRRANRKSIVPDEGATATEYVILITLVAGVIIAIVSLIGAQLGGFFERIAAVF